MGHTRYGDKKTNTTMRVMYYDQGGDSLEPYMYLYKNVDEEGDGEWVPFHGWELKQILKEIKGDDFELFKFLTEYSDAHED